MQKRAQFILTTIILSFLFIIPLTSAEISLTQPNPLYNAGDTFSLDITLKPVEEVSSFLEAKLLCSGNSVEIFRSPLFLSAGEEKQISISSRFDIFLIKKLQGTCLIQAAFGEETTNTEVFTLSRNLAIEASIEKTNFNPGETILITGSVTKEDGSSINGIVEVSSEEIPSGNSAEISSGTFSINFAIPEGTPAGSNLIKITASQKDSKEEILNSGITVINIEVNQIAKEIDIVLDSPSIIPNNDLKYKILILDQTSTEIYDFVLLTIKDPKGFVFSEEQVQSSSDLTKFLEYNLVPGEWSIKTSFKDKEIEKFFTIEELKDLSYEIIDGKLTVTNTGNVPYEDTIKIIIGGEMKSFDINLGIGKSKVYKLSAPNGEYDVSVSTPQGSEQVGTASLTGRAISVSPQSLGISSTTLNILISLIVLIILIILFIFIRRKIKSGSFFFKRKSKSLDSFKESSQNMNKEETISDGKKQESALIALKIKNYETIKNNKLAMETINSALLKAKEAKAKIYVSENYRIVILSQILTKNKENEVEAASVASKIKEILDKYNRLSDPKIRFGLGIHSGELILESDKYQVKFTSLGNTISMAKKISEASNSEILISESVRKKILGKVRAEKVTSKLWKVSDLKSKYKYDEFVKRFEQRRRESSKKE